MSELPRKMTFRHRGRSAVMFRRGQESRRHVLMKAALWARFLDDYPDLEMEGRVGDRHAPDVVAVDADGEPVLWCEAGQVTPAKVERVARRFRRARLVIAKWGGSLGGYRRVYQRGVTGLRREAPVELLVMPSDAARYLDDDGEVILDQGAVASEVLLG